MKLQHIGIQLKRREVHLSENSHRQTIYYLLYRYSSSYSFLKIKEIKVKVTVT